jgi:hypothetical protein
MHPLNIRTQWPSDFHSLDGLSFHPENPEEKAILWNSEDGEWPMAAILRFIIFFMPAHKTQNDNDLSLSTPITAFTLNSLQSSPSSLPKFPKTQYKLIEMCSRRNCRSCGKPTWSGCGAHIESALHGVKKEDRCPNWEKGRSYPCGEVKECPKQLLESFFTTLDWIFNRWRCISRCESM